MEDYENHWREWQEWDDDANPEKDQKKGLELDKKIRNDRNMMRAMSTEAARVSFNEKRSEGEKEVPRTDEVHVLEADMLGALDQIFQTVYSKKDRLAFCVESPKGKQLYSEYVEKVVEYLTRYAKRATRGKEKKDWTERQQRLSRAPMLTKLYMEQLWDDDEMELPFPTDSMLERLWECLEGYDEAFREVSYILITTTRMRDSAIILYVETR
jgi:hypothetical protein